MVVTYTQGQLPSNLNDVGQQKQEFASGVPVKETLILMNSCTRCDGARCCIYTPARIKTLFYFQPILNRTSLRIRHSCIKREGVIYWCARCSLLHLNNAVRLTSREAVSQCVHIRTLLDQQQAQHPTLRYENEDFKIKSHQLLKN